MTRRFNNKKCSAGRGITFAPKYSAKEIKEAKTSIERARRARCLKNIKFTL